MAKTGEPVYVVNLPGYSITEALSMKFQKYTDLPLIIRRRGRCWPMRRRTTCFQIMLIQAAVTLLIVSGEYLYISGGHTTVTDMEERTGLLDSLHTAYQMNQTQNHDDGLHFVDHRGTLNEHLPRTHEEEHGDSSPNRDLRGLTLGQLASQNLHVGQQGPRIVYQPPPAQFIQPLEPMAHRQPAEPPKMQNLAEQYKQLAESALNKELSSLQRQMAQASMRLKDIMDSQHGNP